jgi:catechol 2,3-dioxygenase-like lactoylglutathione lyase family enzyme
VADLARSRAFYEQVVGLQPIPRPDLGPGIWLADASGAPQIHLIVCPEAVPAPTERPNPRGRHTAFLVEDYDGLKRRFKERNIVWSELPDGPVGLPQLFCLDPDGHTLEFQAAERYGDATFTPGFAPTAAR